MLHVSPGRVGGRVAAPASKSDAQRAIAAASLARGRSTITGCTPSADVEAALNAAVALGAEAEHVRAGTAERPGERASAPSGSAVPSEGAAWGRSPGDTRDGGHTRAPAGAVLTIEGWRHQPASRVDCGESGLTLRLFAALAALHDREIVLDGRGTLLARPVGMIEDALGACGVACRSAGGRLPLAVRGPLRGGAIVVDGSLTSQHVTGLLCALPLAAEDTVLAVERVSSRPYLAMTLAALGRFGVLVEAGPGLSSFSIPGRQRYRAAEYPVEGDWSGASCLLVAGAIAGRVEITNLDPRSAQADRAVLDVLRDAGAYVTAGAGSVTVEQAPLRAFEWDASDAPDLVPALAVLACGAPGESRITGVGRLRHKESDRVAALVDLIRALGGAAEARADALLVSGARLAGGAVRTRHDHRMAMAASVAALVTDAGVTIDDAACVSKSYPGFFDDLARVSVPARGGRR